MPTELVKSSWACPRCGRKFEKNNQPHSCNFCPVSKHFEGKAHAKLLYAQLKADVKQNIGPFKVESLPCCIHFVSSFTFLAVKALKGRIRVTFTLNYRLKSSRATKPLQMSRSRFLYGVDVKDESEIDKELMGWLKQAYGSK